MIVRDYGLLSENPHNIILYCTNKPTNYVRIFYIYIYNVKCARGHAQNTNPKILNAPAIVRLSYTFESKFYRQIIVASAI